MAADLRMTEQAARRFCPHCSRSVLATRRVPEGAVADPFVVLGTLGLALLFRKAGLDSKLEPFRCPSCGSALSEHTSRLSRDSTQSWTGATAFRTSQEFVRDLERLSGDAGTQSAAYRKSVRDGVLYYYGARVTGYVDKLVAAGNAARAVKLLAVARPYHRPLAQRLVRVLIAPLLLDLIATGVIVAGVAYMVQSSRSADWPTAEGRVIWSGIDTIRGDDGTTYRAAARYTYTVREVVYEGSRVSFSPFSGSWEQAARAAARYAPGTQVTVHYNPDKPSRAVLEPGMATVGLILAAVGASLLLSSAVTIALLVRRPLAEVRAIEQRLRAA